MKTFALSLLAAGSLLAGCASMHHRDFAASPAPDVDSSAAWSAIDLDASGAVTRDELERQQARGLIQDFAVADADGDGEVSKAEWDGWWPAMTHQPRGEPMTH